MAARWLGPYKIHADLGKGVYRIANAETGLVLKAAVNQCRLKLYLSDKSPTDVSYKSLHYKLTFTSLHYVKLIYCIYFQDCAHT